MARRHGFSVMGVPVHFALLLLAAGLLAVPLVGQVVEPLQGLDSPNISADTDSTSSEGFTESDGTGDAAATGDADDPGSEEADSEDDDGGAADDGSEDDGNGGDDTGDDAESVQPDTQELCQFVEGCTR